jgi:Na+-transporting NADH:ubiquinone oxidoreductase subunit NqrC
MLRYPSLTGTCIYYISFVEIESLRCSQTLSAILSVLSIRRCNQRDYDIEKKICCIAANCNNAIIRSDLLFVIYRVNSENKCGTQIGPFVDLHKIVDHFRILKLKRI